MIYCSHCGKEIPADSQFCPFCGTHVPEVVHKNSAEPVKTEQVVTKQTTTDYNVTKPVVTNIYKGTAGTHKHAEFYLNPGFWGAVMVLVGFFLPIKDVTSTNFFNSGISLFDVVATMGPGDYIVYIYLLFPITAIIILIQSISHVLPSFITIIFKILSLVLLALFAFVIFRDPASYGISVQNPLDYFTMAGLGIWFTVLGTLLMLFYRRYRRIEQKISRVDRVDERL